jgi:hypothetical protein
VHATHYRDPHRATRSQPTVSGTIQAVGQTARDSCCRAGGRGCAGRSPRNSPTQTPQIFSSPKGSYQLEGTGPTPCPRAAIL